MKTLILSTMILMLGLTQGFSQKSAVMEQYIAQGLANNITLQQQHLDVQSSLEALRQAKGMFLPSVYLNASYTQAQGGRNINIPVGDLVNPIYANLNELSDHNNFPTDLPNEEVQLLPDNFHDTRIEIRQPVFNSEIYHSYRARQSTVSIQESKRMTYERELTKEIKVSYFRYLQTLEVLDIYRNTEELLVELLRVNKSLVKNHKATIDVVYSAEFELSDIKSKIAEAQKDINVAKSYFNFLLNVDLDQPVKVDDNLSFRQGLPNSISFYQQQALDGRNELVQLNHAVETQNHLLNLQKGQKLPNVSLGAKAGYQGFGYDFNSNQDYALLSLNLEFPLFTGFQNNSKIQQSKIQVRQLQLEQEKLEKQIKLEVIEAYRNLEAAQATYETKRAAAKSAQKNFNIVNRKYQENLVLLVEYLDARTKYTNSQTSLAISQYLVMIRGAELERAATL